MFQLQVTKHWMFQVYFMMIYAKGWKIVSIKDQLVNIFYFALKPYGLCHNYLTLPL